MHMELLNEFKNEDFRTIRQLINYTLKDGYSLDEVKEYFNEISYFNKPDDFIDKLFDSKCFLLKEDSNCILPIIDYDENSNECYVPILLTKMEKEYLKTMLEDELFSAMLGKELSSKLDKLLEGVNTLNFNDIFIYKDEYNSNYNLKILDKIKFITDSIVQEFPIDFNNNTYDGIRKSYSKYMYRFLYNPINKLWQVTTYDEVQNRVILCTVYKLSDIKESKTTSNCLNTKELIEAKKVTTPLKIKLIDIWTSVERCFRVFADYEVVPYYDSKNNTYYLEVYYYEFDTDQIIMEILSLGDAVVVEDNDSPIYQKIVDIITQIPTE